MALSPKVREEFPILRETVHGRPLVYLDNAATMQLPEPVLQAVTEHYLHRNANVHRGAYELSRRSTDALEGARETVRRFLNARSTDEIVFTSGTTESVNLTADGLEPLVNERSEIIVSELEHHANLIPWQRLCKKTGARLTVWHCTDRGELSLEELKRLLTSDTLLVAVTMASNVTGTVTPIGEICRLAHEAGALVFADGAQAMRHGITDVRAIDCDFLAFSGHKLGSLTGIGVLYGKKDCLERLEPSRFGGGIVDTVTMEETSFAALPQRLEAGTPNYVGAVSLGAALDYLESLGREEVAARERALLDRLCGLLSENPAVRLLGRPKERCGCVSFSVDRLNPYDLGCLLDAQGFAVRTGSLCAQPLLRAMGEESVVRVSPAFFNTEEELARFASALETAVRMLKGGSL